MWTHERPYRRLLPTKDRIEHHAKAELYRSMNKKRLIAFTGSGVTLPYGRLTWDELSRLLIIEVDYLFWRAWWPKDSDDRAPDFKQNDARELHQSLHIAVKAKRLPCPAYPEK